MPRLMDMLLQMHISPLPLFSSLQHISKLSVDSPRPTSYESEDELSEAQTHEIASDAVLALSTFPSVGKLKCLEIKVRLEQLCFIAALKTKLLITFMFDLDNALINFHQCDAGLWKSNSCGVHSI
jgi:hypothetical protein